MPLEFDSPLYLLLLLLLPAPWFMMRYMRQRSLTVPSLLPLKLLRRQLTGTPPPPPLPLLVLQVLALLLLVLAAAGMLARTKAHVPPVVVADNSITGIPWEWAPQTLYTAPYSLEGPADLPADWHSALAQAAWRVRRGAPKALVHTRLSAPPELPGWLEWRTHGAPLSDLQGFSSVRRDGQVLLVGLFAEPGAPVEQLVVRCGKQHVQSAFRPAGYRLLSLPVPAEAFSDNSVLAIELLPRDDVPANDTLRVALAMPSYRATGGGVRRLAAALDALGWQPSAAAAFVVGDPEGAGIRVLPSGKHALDPVRPAAGAGERVCAGIPLPEALPVCEVAAGRPLLLAGGSSALAVDDAAGVLYVGFSPDTLPWAAQGAFCVLIGRALDLLGYPPAGVRCLAVGAAAPLALSAVPAQAGMHGMLPVRRAGTGREVAPACAGASAAGRRGDQIVRAGEYTDAGGRRWVANVLGRIEAAAPDASVLRALAAVTPMVPRRVLLLHPVLAAMAAAAMVAEAMVYAHRRRTENA